MAVLTFEVVSKTGCHLCEDFMQELLRLKAETQFEYRVIDIQQDEAMHAKFYDKIPVLLWQGEMVCHYYFEPEKVKALLISG